MDRLCAVIAAAAAALIAVAAPAGCQAGPLSFLAVGDWGGTEVRPFTTDVQLEVAKQMAITAERDKSSFIFALGDNFYGYGISCENDPTPNCTADATSHRFADTWDNIYTNDSLQVPWYILVGNHDHKGNVSAQIHYSELSSRWTFPALSDSESYYTFTKYFLDEQSRNVSVQYVVIDTVLLAGNCFPGPNGETCPPPRLETDEDVAASQLQILWITETISRSTADWLMVIGHYPVWSIAEHGSTLILELEIKPLLEKYGAALYINGHDHNLQHLNDGSTVEYIDCGAGQFEDPSTAHNSSVPAGSSKFFLPRGGFCSAKVYNSTHAVVDMWTRDNEIVHTIYVNNPRPMRRSRGLEREF